ncbi:MAG: hypothetical protein K6F11_10055 [Lachnospiraceae bacterium]|nr:hypothetical protein [Lachnospiraceae bacterium]
MEERPKRNSWRQFLIVTLFWALAAGLSFVCSEIQLSEIKDTGNATDGASFLNGTLYSYDIVNYVIGAVLFFVLFSLLWFFIMRGRFFKIRRCHIMGQVGCILVTLAGLFFVFGATVYTDMNATGLFGGIEEEFLEALTIFGWALFALLFTLSGTVGGFSREKRMRREGGPHGHRPHEGGPHNHGHRPPEPGEDRKKD